MPKYLLLLILNLLLQQLVFAQEIEVQDAITGKAISGVEIIPHSSLTSIYTDANGRADISSLKGNNEILLTAQGYQLKIISYEQIKIDGFIISLSPSDFQLDRVVVSGSKWKQSNINLPFKISSISKEDVENLTPQTAADLLGISGEVFIQKSQLGGGSPMIRGFSTNRLLYSVDGVRMNNAIFRSGNLQNVISLDPFAIASTEILFGPRAIIYGSDAIGGVMNFTTLTPQFSDSDNMKISGNGSLRYSSANKENTGHIDVQLHNKNWASISSISLSDFDDLQQGSHGPEDYLKPYHVETINGKDTVIQQENPLLQVPTGYSQINLMQKLRFQPSKSLDIQYGFHYSKTSNHGRYDRHNRMRDGLPQYAVWDYGPQKWMMNNLSVQHRGNGIIYDELSIKLAHQLFGESRISRSLYSETTEIREEKVNAYSINVDLTKRFLKAGELYYGIEYVYDDVESTGVDQDIRTNESIVGPSRYPASKWMSTAAYISAELPINQSLSVQLGARYNRYYLDAKFDRTFYDFPFSTATVDNGALTGNLGVVYHPVESWKLRANVSTAFRSPNVDDLGKVFDSEPGAVVVPNPDLESEYAYNGEIGSSLFIGNDINIDFSAYYTLLENAMVRRDFELNGEDSILYDGIMSKVQALQNAAKTTVYGFQFSAEVTLPYHLFFTTKLNYQKGMEELDQGNISPSRHAAPIFGLSRLKFQHGKATVLLTANYQGNRFNADLAEEEQGKTEIYAKDENGNNYSPSWYTLNMNVSYNLSSLIMLNVGIENITDQRYRSYSSGVSGAGRNLIMALNVRL